MRFRALKPGLFVIMNELQPTRLLRPRIYIALLWVLPLMGCDENQLGFLDSRTNTPVLREAFLSTREINIDSLSTSNGSYLIVDTVRVRVDARGDDLNTVSVLVSVFRPSDPLAFFVQTLRDDGIGPDATADDSIYTLRFQFNATRAQAGKYKIQISARNEVGLSANGVDLFLLLKRKNSKPQLFDLQAPDTVQIPAQPQDTVNVQFRVSVADSDGLADVAQVLLGRLDTPTSVRIPLRDDGGLGLPFNFADTNGVLVPRRSGDAVAGDGIYTITIPLLYSSTARTNLFGFQAIDTFGDTSATLPHYITFFRRP